MATGRSTHVLLLPYPIQGHINPMFALARCLASSGLCAIFVHTTTNFAKLQHSQLPANVRIKAIDDGEGAAANERDVMYKQSLQKMQKSLQKLIMEKIPAEGIFIRALIADILMPWTCPVAKRVGARWFVFSVFPAMAVLCATEVERLMQNGLLPFKTGLANETVDCVPVSPRLHVRDVPVDFLMRDREQLELIVWIKDSLLDSAGLIVNAVYELEKDCVDELRRRSIAVYPVGPLLTNVHSSSEEDPTLSDPGCTSLLRNDEACLARLDRQPVSSVLYVAFGSLVELRAIEIRRIGLALEAAEVLFLWSLRVSEDAVDLLPPGFSTRTKDRGLIVPWAPQTQVLSHPATLGFLTHCGSSSVLEALWVGQPMIGLPRISDQNTNLRLIAVDWGVGIPALESDGEISYNGGSNGGCESFCVVDEQAIERAVRAMAYGEEGRQARQRARQICSVVRRAVLKDGASRMALAELASAVMQGVE